MTDTRTAEIVENPEVNPLKVEDALPTPPPPAADVPPPTPDAPVFPGGPSNAQVEAWKAQYGDIYVTEFNNDRFVIWRTMTRFEYRRIMKNMEQALAAGQVGQAEANLNNEESIAETAILWPTFSRLELANQMAGIASIISQEVMEASGFLALNVTSL